MDGFSPRLCLSVMVIPATVLLLIGCNKGPERLETHAVEGRVLLSAEPLSDATVVLHPVQEFAGETIRPRGTTGPDGKFKLTTFESHDGAPIGEYRLTVEKWTTDKPDEGPRNRLNVKYARPETSGLTVSIQAGPNDLQDLKIEN